MSKQKPRLLTGIRPTANLHIGNYLGAIKPSSERLDEFDSFLCIVDLHAITTPYDPKELPRLITESALDWIAGGIDPSHATLFIQSHVHEHTELMWLLNTITPLGELQRMTQYKDFVERFGEPQAGVLNYPILMAADILLYKGEAVPVGDDQTQHIEITRDLAKKFNRTFGDTFPIPKNVTTKPLRIMSLNEPTKKMSKSLGPKSYIALSDSPDAIRRKIASAVTDTGAKSKDMAPGVAGLFELLKLTAPKKSYDHMMEHYTSGALQYSELKAVLADHVIEFLEPVQKKRKELEQNMDYVAQVLAEGTEKAREVASVTLSEVKKKMGLL